MEGYVIAATNEDGSLVGYYTGGSELTEKDLSKATFLSDRTQAKAGMSNLMRVAGDVELGLVPVKLTISAIRPIVAK